MADIRILKQTITSQVVNAIRHRILSGHYAAGEGLRQERIANEMGVSRIPVREALHQLHSEGFVTLVSHKGAVVSEVSLEQILELHELRARIEPWLLTLAIPNMTEESFAAIAAAADRFGASVQDADTAYGANWDYHQALLAAARRPATMEVVGRLFLQIERYTRMLVSLTKADLESDREHRELLALCRKRSKKRAAQLLGHHIMAGSRSLVHRLRELRDDPPAEARKPSPRAGTAQAAGVVRSSRRRAPSRG